MTNTKTPRSTSGDRSAAPFVAWPSPLSAAAVASAGVRKSDVSVSGGRVYWSERRPNERGRTAVVRASAASSDSGAGKVDVVGSARNVRSTAHEYGGACYTVLPGGDIIFVDHTTRSLVRANEDSEQEYTLLQDDTSAFADLLYDSHRERVIAVREQVVPGAAEPIATIVSIEAKVDESAPGKGAEVLIDSRELGSNFVSTPRLSPCGKQLAFVVWRHPHLPWDESELWMADIDATGACRNPRKIAGGDGTSVFQPEFSPDGVLHYVGDQTGWWNLYRFDQGHGGAQGDARNLLPMEAEFGLPQWVFGMSTYALPTPDLLVAICSVNGIWQAGSLDPQAKIPQWKKLSGPSERSLSFFDSVSADQEMVAMLGAGPLDQPMVLAWPTNAMDAAPSVLDGQAFEALDPSSIAVGNPISFASPHSTASALSRGCRQRPCHAFYYPPTSGSHTGPTDALPPLIVKSHGGPTAATNNALDPSIQFWTSRGFALVDVNYGGSTGYGRAYRELLDGLWGSVDVEDCASAALYLADQGLADPQRLIIRGGSAGGFTTLAALAFTDVFCAGASHYGIGDLETLARDTHKFESRYLDRMVGPYPQEQDLYQQRSPIHRADDLSCPVIFFQGSEDKVVPPNQSEAMVKALEAKGVTTKYVLFEGEGHGFRQAENIIRALEEELAFYRAVL